MTDHSKESLQRLLENQSRDKSTLIAARSAIRVFPIVSHPEVINAETELLALFMARCILVSGLGARFPGRNVENMAYHAYVETADVGVSISNVEYTEASNSCMAAALAAGESADSGAYSATETAAEATTEVLGAVQGQVVFDAAFADIELDFKALL